MRVLIIGHAYAASYNRRDKLARIARDDRVVRLAAVVPTNWRDRMMGVDRAYEKISEDELYEIYTKVPVFSGSQSKHFYSPWSLLQIVREFKPDLIHVEQEMSDWVLFEVQLLNKLFWHKPVSVFVWENIRRPYDPITSLFHKFNIQNSLFVIGGNRESLEILGRDGFGRGTAVIPQFGVDENRFQPMDVSVLRDQLDLRQKFVVGFVGRLVEEKGIATLINAVKNLVDHGHVDICLVILSSMEVPSWLKDELDALGARVKLIGKVPHEEFPAYMNLFNVLVLPSQTQADWKEQFGRVLIEAMACGVPVIGSNSGAIPEVIGKMGQVFSEGNAESLANAIQQQMVGQHNSLENKQKLREYVLQNYTHDQIVKKTAAVWENLLQQKA
jgi:glycosyltransferase involved in cell wall biosynthesis